MIECVSEHAIQRYKIFGCLCGPGKSAESLALRLGGCSLVVEVRRDLEYVAESRIGAGASEILKV